MSDCWAVGEYLAGTESRTLIEHWNGSAWAIISSPNASLTELHSLEDVTCASASDCWAAGWYGDNKIAERTLIEHWNGSAWSIVSSPNTSNDDENLLYAVTCISGSNCWAVGDSNGTLIERWNGTSWSIVSSPSVKTDNDLTALTCTSPSDCWAVGWNSYGTLIERWNGTSWSVVDSPYVTGRDILYGVTCISASDCWAVGEYENDSGFAQTLAAHWDGNLWSVVTSPNPNPARHNSLANVTCVSASNCWAVGYYSGNNAFQTLIEHWNGASWSIVASPNTSGGQSNFLWDTKCVSASDCWAVGRYATGQATQTLIQHWNGSSWAIVTSPNTSTTESNDLESVACTSPSDCWAVGYYVTTGINYALIEHWNGTSWGIISSPVSGTYNDLYSVTCAAVSNCWAVGNFYDGNAFRTLVEQWDGSAWSIVTSPNTSANESNYLFGVTCPSGSNCFAAGHSTNEDGIYQTLVLHYTTTPQVASAVSRKIHGAAGPFDVSLPLSGTTGVECRSGGGTNDFTMVVTFASNVTVSGSPQAQVTSGTGTIGSGGVSNGGMVTVAGGIVTIPLTNVADQQTINVTLNGVNSALDTMTTNVVIPMSRLLGDTTGNRMVNAGDVIQTKGRLGQALTPANFRSDVNASGGINTGDVTQAKANSGHGVP